MPVSPEYGTPDPEWQTRVQELLERNGNRHQANTLNLYVRSIHRLYRRSKTKKDVLDPTWLQNAKKVLKSLGPVSMSTIAVYTKAVLNLLLGMTLAAPQDTSRAQLYRYWSGLYQQMLAIIADHKTAHRRIHSIPDSITISYLRDRAEELWSNTESIRHHFQGLYLKLMIGEDRFPPVRTEYAAMQVVLGNDAPTHPNYLRVPTDLRIKGTWELVLEQYKTAPRYGIHRRTIPSALREVLRRSLILHPRSWVIPAFRDMNAPFSNLFNLVDDIVEDVALGPSILRAIFVRDIVAPLSYEDQLWYAQQMMHELRTAVTTYRGGASSGADDA